MILTQFTHRGPIARIKDHLLQHFIRYSQSSFPIYDVFHSARCKAHRRVGNSVCDYFLGHLKYNLFLEITELALAVFVYVAFQQFLDFFQDVAFQKE